ncbi:hypothetical protein Bca101_043973 [Brassica carinata]
MFDLRSGFSRFRSSGLPSCRHGVKPVGIFLHLRSTSLRGGVKNGGVVVKWRLMVCCSGSRRQHVLRSSSPEMSPGRVGLVCDSRWNPSSQRCWMLFSFSSCLGSTSFEASYCCSGPCRRRVRLPCFMLRSRSVVVMGLLRHFEAMSPPFRVCAPSRLLSLFLGLDLHRAIVDQCRKPWTVL